MTKSMTALAILSLRDAGRLALDAPLADTVPQFAAVAPATRDSAPVTVRHLLTHTAGFVTDDPWGDRVLGMSPAASTPIATGRLFARPPGLAFEQHRLCAARPRDHQRRPARPGPSATRSSGRSA